MKKMIGGEFELKTLPHQVQKYDLVQGLDGSWTVSGRAALFALLKSLKHQGIGKVLLPAYLCESVVQPVLECGLGYEYYPVSDTLAALPQPERNSAVVLIHYFGWLNPSTEMLRRESGGSFVLIEDMTQSVLSSWKIASGFKSLVFFSMRKMGPIPLGGWFNLVEKMPPMPASYKAIFWKSVAARFMKYIYRNGGEKRVPGTEKKFLQLFQTVEHTLDASAEPYALDADARKLIYGIDWLKTAQVRKENWSHLHTGLAGAATPFHDHLPDGVVPLGYILHCRNRKDIFARLFAAGVFCPIHWPLSEDIDIKRFPASHALSNSLLTIPIDQRYGVEEMDAIARVIHQAGTSC